MTNGEKFKEVFGFGADGSRVIAINVTWWDCEFQNSKPITNAARIRGMTDEELAAEIVKCRDADDFRKTVLGTRMNTTEEWLDWLRQEVSDAL